MTEDEDKSFLEQVAAEEERKKALQAGQDKGGVALMTLGQLLQHFKVSPEEWERQKSRRSSKSSRRYGSTSISEVLFSNPELLQVQNYMRLQLLIDALVRVSEGDERVTLFLSQIALQEISERKELIKDIDPKKHPDYLRLVSLSEDPLVLQALSAYYEKFALQKNLPFELKALYFAHVIEDHPDQIKATINLHIDLGFEDMGDNVYRKSSIDLSFVWRGVEESETIFYPGTGLPGGYGSSSQKTIPAGLSISYGRKKGNSSPGAETGTFQSIEEFRQFLIHDFASEEPELISRITSS